ncbi:MAG: M20/M25/M40 family metallo-hydrolase [Acidobacteria bacterium]|nr:M20/M25/M40 family metallo-hydrolase [Acidobacteriota bacterium]
MDTAKTQLFVSKMWQQSILPELKEYIRIPNKSPLYDPQWQENGHMERAVALVDNWCRRQSIPGMKFEVVRLEGRTPLLFIDIAGDSQDCVLLYGHLDKQPEMTGWREDLGPWLPVVEEDRLYGRGGADDGYAVFSALTAIKALKDQRQPHARCIVIVESCEESGSYDLPFYIESLQERIGTPSLVICLDSGCGNYDQLWCTTSLRGLVVGDLSVQLLKEGVHSGDGSGVAASSFRVLRQLLSRLEDEKTGEILVRDFHVEIPEETVRQANATAEILGEEVFSKFPFLPGVQPVTKEPAELILNRTWRPALAITGAAGLPSLTDAGNVLRPMTAARISLRIPPGCDPQNASERLKRLFESEPPYNARVEFKLGQYAAGWSAPKLSPWLIRAMEDSSRAFFGKSPAFMGEGGSIPFMDMLGRKYPDAQFLITGVLGPNSNAHGPNEFLHLPTGEKVTSCIAYVLAEHFRRK